MRYRKNIIGPQVRKLREERGWSLDDLATEFVREGIFISPQTLNRVEKRQEFVGTVEVVAFAAIFRTGVERLYPIDLSMSEMEELRSIQKAAGSAKNRRGFLESRIFTQK
jgi:transcriptional regulator with XRE-family HTH domain